MCPHGGMSLMETGEMCPHTFCVHFIQSGTSECHSRLTGWSSPSMELTFSGVNVPFEVVSDSELDEECSPVIPTSRVTVSTTSSTSTLMFSPLRTSDGGQYECVLAVMSGTNSSSMIELNVTSE